MFVVDWLVGWLVGFYFVVFGLVGFGSFCLVLSGFVCFVVWFRLLVGCLVGCLCFVVLGWFGCLVGFGWFKCALCLVGFVFCVWVCFLFVVFGFFFVCCVWVCFCLFVG